MWMWVGVGAYTKGGSYTLTHKPHNTTRTHAIKQGLIKFVHGEMGAYRLYTVTPRLLRFIEDLTNWYEGGNTLFPACLCRVLSMGMREGDECSFPRVYAGCYLWEWGDWERGGERTSTSRLNL